MIYHLGYENEKMKEPKLLIKECEECGYQCDIDKECGGFCEEFEPCFCCGGNMMIAAS